MKVEIDYNPTPRKGFFISVSLSDKEAISFDYTTKAHRIVKQILVSKKPFPKNRKPTSEWDTLIFKHKKFVKEYHVKWIDQGKKDWCNDEVWETVWEKPISLSLKRKLLDYSRLFSDNYKRLDKFSKEFERFEELLKREIDKVKPQSDK